MTYVLRVKKENCLVFQPASPYLPRTSRPYSECQVRNLLLYYTLERREEFSQSIGSVTAAVADTIYAYQQLCLSISTIDDINVRQEALLTASSIFIWFDLKPEFLTPIFEFKSGDTKMFDFQQFLDKLKYAHGFSFTFKR